MVNLVSIIHLTDRGDFHFGNFQEFWDHCYNRTITANKPKMDRLKVLMDNCDQFLSEKYLIPRAHIRSIGYVFMSATEAIRRMEYSEDRELLTNPSNKVVLQIKEKPVAGQSQLTQTVATVYTDTEYHIITSASKLAMATGRAINLTEENIPVRQV